MVNYDNGKIYKIVCNTTGKVYIGSTTKKYLSQRLAKHKADYKRYLNGLEGYITSYEILKNGNYDMILIESFPCNSKDELFSRERYYTNTIDCVNKVKNQGIVKELGKKEYKKQTDKKYRENNQEKIKKMYKEYRQKNLETIKTKAIQKFTCECGSTCSKTNKAAHTKSNKHLKYVKSLEPKEE